MNTKATPRAVRNNNPLNIRRNAKSPWQGMAAQQTDPAFVVFTQQKYGWRAAFILLTRTYYHKYGICTPAGIIRRWAPASENDVDKYIETVCGLTGLKPDQKLDVPLVAAADWMMLAAAMAIVEGGPNSVDYFAMMEGWKMARHAIQMEKNPAMGLEKGLS